MTTEVSKLIKNEKAEKVFLGICFSIALFLSYLLITDTTFFYSSYGALSRENSLLAEVYQNDNDVRYSPSHLPIWEDSYPEQNLFRKDKIFTEAESKSEIKFINDSSIIVDENSLVIIDEFDGAPAVNLLKGSIQTRIGRESDALRILRNGKRIDLQGRNSLVQIHEDGRITAIDKDVSLNENGKLVRIAKGETYGEIEVAETPSSPESEYIEPGTTKLEVTSSWRGGGNQNFFQWQYSLARQFTSFRVEISRDSQFSDNRTIRKTLKKKTLDVTNLRQGTYFWRIQTAFADGTLSDWSKVKSFTIASPKTKVRRPFRLKSGLSNAYATPDQGVEASLSWRGLGKSFDIELSKSPSFVGPPIVLKRQPSRSLRIQNKLPAGTYYWRVRSIAQNGKKGQWSERKKLFVESEESYFKRISALSPPQGFSSVQNNSDTLASKWELNSPALFSKYYTSQPKYEFQIAKNSRFSNRKSFTLEQPKYDANKLKPGRYYLRVRILLPDGRRGKWSTVKIINLADTKNLAGPVVNKPKPAPPTIALPVKTKVRIRTKKIKLPAPVVSYPENKSIVDIKKQKLEWNQITSSLDYKVEIYSYKNPKKPILVKTSSKNVLNNLKLKPGKYFWRVASYSKDKIKSFSKKNTFIVKDLDALKALEALKPDPSDRITTSQIATDVEFAWLADKKAAYYIIEASLSENFLTTFFSTKVEGESSKFNFPQGTFYWKVSSFNKSGKLLKAGKINTFSVAATMGRPKFYGDSLVTKNLPKGQTIADLTVTWSKIPRAERYEVELASDEKFEFVELNTTRIETDIPLSLEHGKYFSRVKSVDIYGFGSEWSDTKILEITSSDLKSGPSLILPKDDANFVYRKKSSPISFRWKKAKKSILYEIQISKTINFADIHFKLETPKSSIVKSLKKGEYFWRVKGIDNNGFASAWSETRKFNLGLENSLVKLISPTASIKKGQGGATNFSWDAPKDVSKFKVIVSRDPNFTDIIAQKDVTGRKTASLDLEHEGEAYWVVEGENIKERFTTRSATGNFIVSSRSHWDPNGHVQISLAPKSTQYSSGSSEQKASMLNTGILVRYWFSQSFGLTLGYKAGQETIEDQSYLRSRAQFHLLARKTLLSDSSARFSLIGGLGLQQLSLPDGAEESKSITMYSLGLTLHKPLSDNWATEFEMMFASLAGEDELIQNAQNLQFVLSLQQKIAKTWRLGYGLAYESLDTSGEDSSTESTRTDQSFELSIGRDF